MTPARLLYLLGCLLVYPLYLTFEGYYRFRSRRARHAKPRTVFRAGGEHVRRRLVAEEVAA
jgi:hypothetical protein